MLLNRGANANSQRKVELLNYFDIFCYDIFVMIFFFLKDGATPLFFAAQKGYEQIVQILLEKGGANANLADQVLFYFYFEFVESFDFFFYLFHFCDENWIELFFLKQKKTIYLFFILTSFYFYSQGIWTNPT